MQKQYKIDEIDDIATLLLEKYPSYNIFCLIGEMGAGKTTLCTAIETQFLGTNEITSSSFNLISEHQSNNKKIIHYDLHRVKSNEELYELGIFDLNNSDLILIEWPEIILRLSNFTKNNNILIIELNIIDDNTRIISIKPIK